MFSAYDSVSRETQPLLATGGRTGDPCLLVCFATDVRRPEWVDLGRATQLQQAGDGGRSSSTLPGGGAQTNLFPSHPPYKLEVQGDRTYHAYGLHRMNADGRFRALTARGVERSAA